MSISPILSSSAVWLIGAMLPVAFEVWDSKDSSIDLSGASATIQVFNRDGDSIVGPSAATISGTTTVTCSLAWDTTGLDAGSYRCVLMFSFGGTVSPFQSVIVLVPLPAPQNV